MIGDKRSRRRPQPHQEVIGGVRTGVADSVFPDQCRSSCGTGEAVLAETTTLATSSICFVG
jgi:hypothetical protein